MHRHFRGQGVDGWRKISRLTFPVVYSENSDLQFCEFVISEPWGLELPSVLLTDDVPAVGQVLRMAN